MSWLTALLINTVLIAAAQRAPLLTAAGWVHAGALGTILWGAMGWQAWLAVVAYLGLGSLVTKIGWNKKNWQISGRKMPKAQQKKIRISGR